MKERIDFAHKLAYQAGEIMLEYFNNHEIKQKLDKTPVTIADEKINNLVIEKVKLAFPEDGILGEEASYEQQRESLWVVDPIDGTLPYIHGLPISYFSLAYVLNGKTQFGICYRPFDNTLYFGDGKIATKNSELIKVNSMSKVNQSTCNIFFDNSPLLKDSGAVLNLLRKSFHRGLIFYCIVAESMLVAEGKIEASIYPFGSAHDIAGLKPIIEGAGGKVTDLFGRNEQRYDCPIRGAIMSNGKIHEDIAIIMREYENIRD